MTTIQALTIDGQYSGFDVVGHAGAGTIGNDLVCAAVSFLAITCANALESVAKVKPVFDQADGRMWVFVNPHDLNHDAKVILDVFMQGAKDLLEAYPANVQLIK
ncbi:MAG: ribosomal-processing cysteine protease Prp [Candidatus Micrarchaeia archaeon]|jgi:hypothetical protein